MPLYRFSLRQPAGPKHPHRDRPWKEFERECTDLREAAFFMARQLDRTNPELLERISNVGIRIVRAAPVPAPKRTPKVRAPEPHP